MYELVCDCRNLLIRIIETHDGISFSLGVIALFSPKECTVDYYFGRQHNVTHLGYGVATLPLYTEFIGGRVMGNTCL